MLGQAVAFATDVPPDIYAFHRYTGNSTTLSHTLAEQSRLQFQVEPGDFTIDLLSRLRALYAQ